MVWALPRDRRVRQRRPSRPENAADDRSPQRPPQSVIGPPSTSTRALLIRWRALSSCPPQLSNGFNSSDTEPPQARPEGKARQIAGASSEPAPIYGSTHPLIIEACAGVGRSGSNVGYPGATGDPESLTWPLTSQSGAVRLPFGFHGSLAMMWIRGRLCIVSVRSVAGVVDAPPHGPDGHGLPSAPLTARKPFLYWSDPSSRRPCTAGLVTARMGVAKSGYPAGRDVGAPRRLPDNRMPRRSTSRTRPATACPRGFRTPLSANDRETLGTARHGPRFEMVAGLCDGCQILRPRI